MKNLELWLVVGAIVLGIIGFVLGRVTAKGAEPIDSPTLLDSLISEEKNAIQRLVNLNDSLKYKSDSIESIITEQVTIIQQLEKNRNEKISSILAYSPKQLDSLMSTIKFKPQNN